MDDPYRFYVNVMFSPGTRCETHPYWQCACARKLSKVVVCSGAHRCSLLFVFFFFSSSRRCPRPFHIQRTEPRAARSVAVLVSKCFWLTTVPRFLFTFRSVPADARQRSHPVWPVQGAAALLLLDSVWIVCNKFSNASFVSLQELLAFEHPVSDDEDDDSESDVA
jgi:hypothetical protein